MVSGWCDLNFICPMYTFFKCLAAKENREIPHQTNGDRKKNGTWNKNQWTIYICDMESIFSAGAEWEDVFSVRSFFSFFFCVGRFFLFSIMANHKATNFQCFGKKRQERHRYSSSVFHLNSITQIRWKKKFVFLI